MAVFSAITLFKFEDNFMQFYNLIEILNKLMISAYISVDPKTNPVSINMAIISRDQLQYILGQYAVFSRKIVSFLVDAFYVMKYEGWDNVTSELQQNISEEFGEDGKDSSEPHYVLLRKGFEKSLDLDLSSLSVYPATQKFITSTHNTIANNNSAYVAGAVYALESTATPELIMTFEFTNELFRRHNIKTPTEVRKFFGSHINEIEIEHEARLKDACSTYINDVEKCIQFEKGFNSILQIMDDWWQGMYTESLSLSETTVK